MTDQFKKYLQYQPFLVKTDNNPLTYVMAMPNLDTIGHRWVVAMVGYNFEIEYVQGVDNNDNEDAVKELLSHATWYGVPWARADDPRVVEEHDKMEGEVIMQAQMVVETKKNYQNLVDSHWVVAQHGNMAIRLVIDWLKRRKDNHRMLDQYLKHQVPNAEHQIYAVCQKDFVLRHNLLYLRTMPKRSNEDVLVFVVPRLKHQVAIDGCHQYLGHQGRDRTLSLLRERFWWLGMAQRMMMNVRNCKKCRIFEAKPQILPMEPIICMEPLDLLHIDYVSMEVTVGIKGKPGMKNMLVFTRYTQAYITNNHMVCTMAHMLYNEFLLCLGSLDD